jgi:hypothetical protein
MMSVLSLRWTVTSTHFSLGMAPQAVVIR